MNWKLLNEQLNYLIEQIAGKTAQKLKDDLGNMPGFENFEDRDWNRLGDMIKKFGWTGIVFSGVMPSLIKYFYNARNGLPATFLFITDKNQLKTDRYDSAFVVNILTKYGALEELKIRASEAVKGYAVSHDEEWARKHPLQYVKTYWATPELDELLKFLKRKGVPIRALWDVFEEEY